jgi:plastocyanin
MLIGSATMAAVVLGACGDDGDEPGDAAGVTVVAEDTLSFDEGDYRAEAGETTITYEAGGSIHHTLLIEGVEGFELEVRATGDSETGTVELGPGSYELYCDVAGHEGMRATLTVT